MTFADWVHNSIDDIQRNGVDGIWSAIEEFWWGTRHRIRRLHWLTPNTQTLTAGGVSVEIAQEHIGEFDAIRAFHNEDWFAQDLVAEIGPQDVFWDIGGNIGVYSVLAAKTGADVVTFEPWLENAATIEQNARRNASSDQVRVVPKALADENGVREFTLDERGTPGSGRGSLLDDWQNGPTRMVECIRGDEAISVSDIPTPDVVKIDVEGTELAVLDGMGSLLDTVRVCYVELHGIEDEAVRVKFQEAGFSIKSDVDKTGCGLLKARNKAQK